MNYLTLASRAWSDMGLSGVPPADVTKAQSMHKRVCEWVREADVHIQQLHYNWSFLWKLQQVQLKAGQAEYTLNELGLTDFNHLIRASIGEGSSVQSPIPPKPASGTARTWLGTGTEPPMTPGQVGRWIEITQEIGYTGTWPLTLANPVTIPLWMSDGSMANLVIPAKTYPDAATSDSGTRTGANGLAWQLVYEPLPAGMVGTMPVEENGRFFLRLDQPDTVAVHIAGKGSRPTTNTKPTSWSRMALMPFDPLSVYNTGMPSALCFTPARHWVLNAVPDKDYWVSFEYYRTPKELTGNFDTPLIPDEWQHAIVHRAKLLYALYDESASDMTEAKMEYDSTLVRMESRLLPPIEFTPSPFTHPEEAAAQDYLI